MLDSCLSLSDDSYLSVTHGMPLQDVILRSELGLMAAKISKEPGSVGAAGGGGHVFYDAHSEMQLLRVLLDLSPGLRSQLPVCSGLGLRYRCVQA